MANAVEKGNVVATYTFGNTKAYICDDYCRDKTPEEVEEILTRIGSIAMRHLSAATYEARKTS